MVSILQIIGCVLGVCLIAFIIIKLDSMGAKSFFE